MVFEGIARALSFAHPLVEVGQCLWHIYRNVVLLARDKTRRSALLTEAKAIFEEKTLEPAQEKLKAFLSRWKEEEPEVCQSILRASGFGLNHLTSKLPFARRTTSHVERTNREFRRMYRPMEIFRSERYIQTYLDIWREKINSTYSGEDWLRKITLRMLN